MVRKYKYNTESEIEQQNLSFKRYIQTFLLDYKSWELLLQISRQTDVYIFSGVIRNFLLGYIENRDLDIVIRNINGIDLREVYHYDIKTKKNSFGGYKLKIGMLNVDVWDINKTWGIQNMQLESTPQNLIKTAFFNFSAIVYDFNRSKFIYNSNFIDFYETHAMDIQYEENPNIPLCIINTLYYSLKYSFPIKYNLCKWIVTNYDRNINFYQTQIRHFKRIIFRKEQIERLINICIQALPILNQNRVLRFYN